MQIQYIPHYCGGRLLIGFYKANDDDRVIHNSIIDQKTYEAEFNQNRLVSTAQAGASYSPNNLLKFQQCLQRLLGLPVNNSGYYGAIIAITNKDQLIAADNLKATGFKLVDRFQKYDGYITGNKTTGYGWCALWVGDFRNDIRPILSKIEPWVDPNDTSKSKFAK